MAKTVRRIEAKSAVDTARKRVAAYARVSMETDRLEHSLSKQISYYSALIQRHPGWGVRGRLRRQRHQRNEHQSPGISAHDR